VNVSQLLKIANVAKRNFGFATAILERFKLGWSNAAALLTAD